MPDDTRHWGGAAHALFLLGFAMGCGATPTKLPVAGKPSKGGNTASHDASSRVAAGGEEHLSEHQSGEDTRGSEAPLLRWLRRHGASAQEARHVADLVGSGPSWLLACSGCERYAAEALRFVKLHARFEAAEDEERLEALNEQFDWLVSVWRAHCDAGEPGPFEIPAPASLHLSSAARLVASEEAACALADGRRMWCWGGLAQAAHMWSEDESGEAGEGEADCPEEDG